MNTIIVVSIAFLSLVIGYFFGKNTQQKLSNNQILQLKNEIDSEKNLASQQKQFLESNLNSYQNKVFQLEAMLHQANQEKHDLDIALNKKETEFDILLDKLQNKEKEIMEIQDKLKSDFEVLAQKILEEKSTKFTEINSQKIQAILNPLHEKIQSFENKVHENQRVNIDYHGQLKSQIENLQKVSLKMNEETLNLTRALKSESKTQGNWGELVLEKVLEKSGLEKGREYFTQANFKNENDKNIFPDVVINLPDGKCMIIDSKVSLTAYERYVNETNEDVKTQHLKQHVASINQHVEGLSLKRYQDVLENKSPDFVLMFIPIESAFAAALQEQHNLYIKAFEINIIIVTPTTLLATLRTIDSMWTNQKQHENAITIAKEAGALYDKFAGLIADLNNIGVKIKSLDKDYNQAINKLYEGNGNLVKRVERLRELGAKATKNLKV